MGGIKAAGDGDAFGQPVRRDPLLQILGGLWLQRSSQEDEFGGLLPEMQEIGERIDDQADLSGRRDVAGHKYGEWRCLGWHGRPCGAKLRAQWPGGGDRKSGGAQSQCRQQIAPDGGGDERLEKAESRCAVERCRRVVEQDDRGGEGRQNGQVLHRLRPGDVSDDHAIVVGRYYARRVT
nr:hypothetical protein [Acidisphaera sp. L21]